MPSQNTKVQHKHDDIFRSINLIVRLGPECSVIKIFHGTCYYYTWNKYIILLFNCDNYTKVCSSLARIIYLTTHNNKNKHLRTDQKCIISYLFNVSIVYIGTIIIHYPQQCQIFLSIPHKTRWCIFNLGRAIMKNVNKPNFLPNSI